MASAHAEEPPFVVRDDVLPTDVLASVRDAVLQSRALGDNPLAGTFTSTRGFGLLFTHKERDALCARHGWATPFLDLALSGAAPDYACYLNALLVPAGGAVQRHVDGTLREPLGADDALPVDVTVLYLSASERSGHLRLSPDGEPPTLIAPRAARLVRFRGDLPHEVLPGAPGDDAPRLSLVLERYRPSSRALAQFVPRLETAPPVVDVAPVFRGGSSRPFASLVRGLCSTADDRGPEPL